VEGLSVETTAGQAAKDLVGDIQAVTKDVVALDGSQLRRASREALDAAVAELATRVASLDPVRQPYAVFDPSNSSLFGVFAAIALIGQDTQPLDDVVVDKVYGSGVYALYYVGDNHVYAPISGTETPIYVGKADPPRGARTPKEQGPKLTERLAEHRKNIIKAQNLALEDFRCRRLVVATGWQAAAESALINLFNPIWNKETRILDGFGKHGDSSKTRANKRSPWDVLHPGRGWALAPDLLDARPLEAIKADVADHYKLHAPFTDAQAIIHELIAQVGVQQV
jgi:hypothetical protein